MVSGLKNKQEQWFFLCSFFLLSLISTVFAGDKILCSDCPLKISIGLILFSVVLLLFTEKKKQILSIMFAVGAFVFAFGYQTKSIENIRISSICRKCESDFDDEYGNDVAYVELHNRNSYPIHISKIYLSDGTAWNDYACDDLYIEENGHLRLLVDGGIELSKQRSTIITLNINENHIIDEVMVPGLKKNEAYDVDKKLVYSLISEKIDKPVFSVVGGYYEEPFILEITGGDDSATIYYTLDGSEPDENSFKYSEPICVNNRSAEMNVYRNIPYVVRDYKNFVEPENVDKITVVRAVSIDENGVSSPIATSSYIVGLPEYKNKTVVSLVSDPDDLFSPERGIYVVGRKFMDYYESDDCDSSMIEQIETNYWVRGKEAERRANIEIIGLFDEAANQEVGIRVRGNSSVEYPLKRFSVFCRKEYSGSNYFDRELFGSSNTHSFLIRYGSDHAISNLLVTNDNLAHASAVPVSVFVDGEFWYDAFLIDKMNDYYFEDKYGISRNNVMIANNGSVEDDFGEDGLLNINVLSFLAENDIAKSSAYEQLNEMIDIQSYILYQCTNIYLGNHDYGEEWNTKAWRAIIPENDGYGDGRWRWMLYDMDLWRSAAVENNGLERTAEINSFTMVKDGWAENEAVLYQPMFSYLIWNDDFCRDFVNTFMDLVNTDFSVDNAEQKLKYLGFDLSYDSYFFRDRESYITGYMEELFGLSGVRGKICVNLHGAGAVSLNSLTLTSDYQGEYYTDYPVRLSCLSDDFDHWIINGSVHYENTVNVDITASGAQIDVIFKDR